MQDYNKYLKEQFGDLVINIVKHDDSPMGMPCYIEAHLSKTPKDKGQVALDLGNYISRLGLSFQSVPEYRGKGKETTLRWFMSWDNVKPILGNIKKAFDINHQHQVLPVKFTSLIIQNVARGVTPKLGE